MPFATITVFYEMGTGREYGYYSLDELMVRIHQAISENTPFQVGHIFGNIDGTHPKRK